MTRAENDELPATTEAPDDMRAFLVSLVMILAATPPAMAEGYVIVEEAEGQAGPAARGQAKATSLAPGSGAQRKWGDAMMRIQGSGRCDFNNRVVSITYVPAHYPTFATMWLVCELLGVNPGNNWQHETRGKV